MLVYTYVGMYVYIYIYIYMLYFCSLYMYVHAYMWYVCMCGLYVCFLHTLDQAAAFLRPCSATSETRSDSGPWASRLAQSSVPPLRLCDFVVFVFFSNGFILAMKSAGFAICAPFGGMKKSESRRWESFGTPASWSPQDLVELLGGMRGTSHGTIFAYAKLAMLASCAVHASLFACFKDAYTVHARSAKRSACGPWRSS